MVVRKKPESYQDAKKEMADIVAALEIHNQIKNQLLSVITITKVKVNENNLKLAELQKRRSELQRHINMRFHPQERTRHQRNN
jgi:predicted nuclease with TOPRIM domain